MVVAYFMQDRNRTAQEINCAVCAKCSWRNGRKNDFCTYGGPYVGYDETRLTPAVESAPVAV